MGFCCPDISTITVETTVPSDLYKTTLAFLLYGEPSLPITRKNCTHVVDTGLKFVINGLPPPKTAGKIVKTKARIAISYIINI